MFLVQCIDYRANIHCSGDIIEQFYLDRAIYQDIEPTESDFERCGNQCLSTPGATSFNWLIDLNMTNYYPGNCLCLGSGKD